MNIDIAEGRLFENLAVGRAVESHTAGQAQRFLPGAPVDMIQQREVVFFEDHLHGGGQVGMPRGDFVAGRARRAEHLEHFPREHAAGDRLAAIPGHLDAVAMMRKVIEVEAAIAGFGLDDLANLRGEAGLAVSGQTHHFVLVAVLREAQKLSEGGVENAERVREQHGAEQIDAIAAADAPLNAAVIAETIDRDYGSFFEGRGKEGAGEVRAVVLHLVDFGALQLGKDGAGPLGAEAGYLDDVGDAGHGSLPGGRTGGRVQHFSRDVREWIAGDGHVFDVVSIRPVETGGGGEIGESRPMLDAV